MQIQREEAWEIWSRAVSSGRQRVATWGAAFNCNNSHFASTGPWHPEKTKALMLPCKCSGLHAALGLMDITRKGFEMLHLPSVYLAILALPGLPPSIFNKHIVSSLVSRLLPPPVFHHLQYANLTTLHAVNDGIWLLTGSRGWQHTIPCTRFRNHVISIVILWFQQWFQQWFQRVATSWLHALAWFGNTWQKSCESH